MSVAELVNERREEILRLAAAHGADNARVFGSVTQDDEASDLDLLVDLEPGRSLLDRGGLLMDVRAPLDRPVDVVTERGLRAHPRAGAA